MQKAKSTSLIPTDLLFQAVFVIAAVIRLCESKASLQNPECNQSQIYHQIYYQMYLKYIWDIRIWKQQEVWVQSHHSDCQDKVGRYQLLISLRSHKCLSPKFFASFCCTIFTSALKNQKQNFQSSLAANFQFFFIFSQVLQLIFKQSVLPPNTTDGLQGFLLAFYLCGLFTKRLNSLCIFSCHGFMP